MTREEAIKICKSHIHFDSNGTDDPGKIVDHAGASSVDMFVALGMLKLDEPRDPTREAWQVIGSIVDDSYARSIMENLEDAGLKIVLK